MENSSNGADSSEIPEPSKNGDFQNDSPKHQNGLRSPENGLESVPRKQDPKTPDSAYSKVMKDEEFEEDSDLKQQELDAAQKIIDESKAIVESPPPKRKRGRPRKGEEKTKRPSVAELTPRTRERRAAVVKREAEKEAERRAKELRREQEEEKKRNRIARKLKAEEEDSGDESEVSSVSEDSDDEFEESEDEKPKKTRRVASPRKPRAPSAEPPKVGRPRGRPRKEKVPAPPKEKKPPKPPVERRAKKGRPSKQEKVTGKVHSIFHMDDMEFFNDRPETPSAPATPSKPKSSISLNFDNTGDSSFSSVPSISGLKDERAEETTADTPISQFVPLPVPELDQDGNIKDQEYVKKYFPDSQIQSNFSGRLTDERAYFLEGSEGYFEQHNLRFRPSSSALSSRAPELDYDEFLPMVKMGSLIHKNEREALNKLHKELYHQWCFELSQGYNLNFYGIGSKANLILDFVNNYFLDWYERTLLEDEDYPVVMVVNGYNPATKLKSVIHDIASSIVTPAIRKENNLKMPKHIGEAFPFLVTYMKRHLTYHSESGLIKPKLILVIHNIDGEAFRDERSQNILSKLASLPDVWLITSVDNVNASLLWDLNRFKNFNFLWHDATTYEPYGVELSFKDVLSLGRSKKFVGSKGAKFVLTSLSSNAQNLYRVLSQMQLKVLEESTSSKAGRTGLRGSIKLGVEMKKLYEECLREFVTSNEMNFRSILGEYVEHKMCSLTKNASGKEIVFIPYAYDEIALILKEHYHA